MSFWQRCVGVSIAVTLPLGLAACAGGAGQGAGPTGTAAASLASSSASATAGPTQGEAMVRGYEFPGGMIAGLVGGGQTYSRVEGVLAVATGGGRHPVVVLIHGSYPSCLDPARDRLLPGVATVPWPQGCGTEKLDQGQGITQGPDYVRTPASLAYLATELTRRGYAVVIPDVNSKERPDWGGEPDLRALQTSLAKLHLDQLRRLDGGDALGLSWGKDVAGRLDTGTVAVVGHSSGAGWAIQAAFGRDLPGTKAAVALEPALRGKPRRRRERPRS